MASLRSPELETEEVDEQSFIPDLVLSLGGTWASLKLILKSLEKGPSDHFDWPGFLLWCFGLDSGFYDGYFISCVLEQFKKKNKTLLKMLQPSSGGLSH